MTIYTYYTIEIVKCGIYDSHVTRLHVPTNIKPHHAKCHWAGSKYAMGT